MTVRVGINLLWLVPGVVGGSEESTVASLRALAAVMPGDLHLEAFALEAFAQAHPEVVAALPTSTLAIPAGGRPARVVAEATWLVARTRGLDLVHHAGGTAPPVRTEPYVLTIHDLQPLERSATHGPVKRAYLGTVVPRAAHHARAIVVPSEFVRRSLLARFDLDPAAVHVVPHGVERWRAAPLDEVRARHRLAGPVVLYPAITYPHKNHAVLVEAFSRVVAEHPAAVLVFTGGVASSEPALREQVERLGLTACVRRTARIPAPELAALYELASVVAVPSRYEGFGLPAAEAMAFGRPVVAAAATALPEVVGDAGVLVAPDDVTGWAAAISRLLADPQEAERLAEAGRERVAGLSWTANAVGLLDAYRSALA